MSWPIRRGAMKWRMASMIEPCVSPVITAVAAASPWPMWPLSVRISTITSSTVSTVRSAVLNGVFSGTRSMPSSMWVIFILGLSGGCAGCW